MLRPFPRPYTDKASLIANKPYVFDLLWGCGQRASIVHQIHSLLLTPNCKCSDAARSLGRGNALWRIDLYTARTSRPLTRIDIHVNREPTRCDSDQTTSGSRWTINLAGRQPPHRVRGKLTSCCLNLYRRAIWYQALLDELPEDNCQSARKCDDADLAAAHAGTGEPLPPPLRQCAIGLVARRNGGIGRPSPVRCSSK